MGQPSFAALRPLERSRLYEDVVARLAEFVTESGLKVGDRFPAERDLAQRLGVSRTSVRQAMVVLQAHGFVDIRHGGGIFLRRTRDFGESLPRLLERRRRLPEVLEAREVLEVKLAELAARRHQARDAAAMEAATRKMAADIAAGGLGLEGDAEFHQTVARAARNRILEHLIEAMAEAIRESRVESLSEPGRPPRSLEAHRRILAAVRARDPEGAADAMRDHLREVSDVALLRWRPQEENEGGEPDL